MHDFLKNKIIFEDMEYIFGRQNGSSWLKGKRVMITGAYGMLASYIVYYLIFLNENIFSKKIDIIAQGRNLVKMKERFGIYIEKDYFHIYQDDICKESNINIDIDYVIHAASLASPQYYLKYPVDVFKPNILGTYYLLEMAKKNNVKSFLFFSSGDVYGQLPCRNEMYTELDYGYLDCANVRSCYGESKRMGETICKSYYEQFGVPAKMVRIAHTYGPTLDLENDERMFAEFTRNIVQNQNIIMKSDGTAERMFCYISDAVDAFLRVLYYGENGEAYNMYNNMQLVTIKELAYILVHLYPEKNLKVEMVNRSTDASYSESPIKKSPVMSTEKLEKLGWIPQIDIREGFFRTINSFIERCEK